MEHMAVADLKTNFSAIIDRVRAGEEIEILYGRTKTPVARLVPIPPPRRRASLLGCLGDKARIVMSDDWQLDPEEMLNL